MKGREKEIYDIIVEYIKQHQYPPTVREIGEIAGLKSACSVQVYIERLFNKGLLETDVEAGAARAIRVPGYKFVKENENV